MSEIIHIQPDIVYVHVGENDLCSLHASNVSPITSHLCHIIDKLTPHTRIIFLSKLLLFPVYTHARQSVLSVNNNMKCHCAQLESVNVWRHRVGFWRQPVDFLGQRPRQQLFDVHGVHLTEEGNKVYWRSVRVAVEKGLKRLSK